MLWRKVKQGSEIRMACARDNLTEKVIFHHRFEVPSHVALWGINISDGENSKCKGPEAPGNRLIRSMWLEWHENGGRLVDEAREAACGSQHTLDT